MTREEQAIVYFKDMRKRMCEDHLKICPKDSVAYHATLIEKGFYDAAIKALEQKPCEDAVSKKDVLSEIIRFSTEEGASVECQQLYCDVNNMPSVTPIRPKGHWINHSDEGYVECPKCGSATNCDVNDNTPYFVDDIACSECLAKFCIVENEVERFDSCPNCGADMREVEE